MTSDMNRETIEKAARDYVMPNENIRPLMESIVAKEGFIAGADWRINSVWHEANDKPEFCGKKGIWIVMYFEHGMLSATFVRNDEWDELRKRNNFAKWAYQTDILPDRKEADQ